MTITMPSSSEHICFLETVTSSNQYHSPEYPKSTCFDTTIISPCYNCNPIMAQFSSFHQHSPFAFISYKLTVFYSLEHEFSTTDTYTHSFYSSFCLQITIHHFIPHNTHLTNLQIRRINNRRWIHNTHNAQDSVSMRMKPSEQTTYRQAIFPAHCWKQKLGGDEEAICNFGWIGRYSLHTMIRVDNLLKCHRPNKTSKNRAFHVKKHTSRTPK